MARFMNKVKLAWLRGVEVIGTSASNLASNAKFKVAEINLETRRREIMAEFTQKAYALWQNGTALPEPLNGMLQEANDLDERLSVLRAQRYAAVDGEAGKPGQEEAAKSDGHGEWTGKEAENVVVAVAEESGQGAPWAPDNEEGALQETSQEVVPEADQQNLGEHSQES